MNEEKDYVEKTLDDHECRLRKLEESDIRQQIQLTEIQKSQSDIKVLVMDTAKEQNDMAKEQNETMREFNKSMLETLTSTIKNNNDTTNGIKLTDRKEFWGVIVIIVGIGATVVTYLCNK